MKPKDRRRNIEILLGAGLMLLLAALTSARGFEPFEKLFLDAHFRLQSGKKFPEDIAVIGIDEASLDVIGRWPWSRDLHAALIGLFRHESFQPAALGYDVLFEVKSTASPEGDELLVHQAGALEGRAVTAYFFEKGKPAAEEVNESKEKELERFALRVSGPAPEHLEEAQKVSLPFLDLARASSLAFVNTPMDTDGRTRHAQLLIRYKGKVYPSMDLLIALIYLRTNLADVHVERRGVVLEKSSRGRIVIPVDEEGKMIINYFGSSRVIPTYSFVQVMNEGKAWMEGGKPPPLLRALKGKIVLVGVTALGLGDRRVTPLAQYETGISLHAHAIGNILRGNFLVKASEPLAWGAFVLLGLTALWLTMQLPVQRALPAMLALGVLYFAATHFFFIQGLWLPMAGPVAEMTAVFIGVTCFRYFTALEELKRTQQQLIQSAKMAALGELSSGMAHEFRNILSSISLHVEYALRPGMPPDKTQKNAVMARQVIRNAVDILNGLLTFARKKESVKVRGNLKKTVEDALMLVEKDLAVRNVKVVLELQDVEDVAFDAGQISQVVLNMVQNARDAMEKQEDKRLVLRLARQPDGARIEIADNGPGIAPSVLKHLFQPFVTTKPEGHGTGLGLSVCHGIVENHGGRITVETSPAKGTAWSIFIPA
ncbi:MAG TPA: CHASE2 domain-containing protein [Verrucomicrobiae bacterium]|nr:CHASE2 domain-containing protein [Verrucomicrobiae bacterium]